MGQFLIDYAAILVPGLGVAAALIYRMGIMNVQLTSMRSYIKDKCKAEREFTEIKIQQVHDRLEPKLDNIQLQIGNIERMIKELRK